MRDTRALVATRELRRRLRSAVRQDMIRQLFYVIVIRELMCTSTDVVTRVD